MKLISDNSVFRSMISDNLGFQSHNCGMRQPLWNVVNLEFQSPAAKPSIDMVFPLRGPGAPLAPWD